MSSPIDQREPAGMAQDALRRHWPGRSALFAMSTLVGSRNPRLDRSDRDQGARRSRIRLPWLERSGANGVGLPGGSSAVAGLAASDGREDVEVAHEALIRHWPRLRRWLDEDRTALLRREEIRDAAQQWAAQQRDESYLAHRGRRLDAALDLRHHPRVQLNALEHAYLAAALGQREREAQEREAQRQRELDAERERAELAEAARREAEHRAADQMAASRKLRQRFLLAAGLGIVAVVAFFVAGYFLWNANQQRELAERQASLALVRALQVRSQQLSGEDSELGALLARQAYLFDREGDGSEQQSVHDALRMALAESPFRVILQPGLGSAIPIRTIAFRNQGLTVVAIGEEAGARGVVSSWNLWRPSAANSERFSVPAMPRPRAVDPTGELMVGVDEDGRLAVWNLRDPAQSSVLLAEAAGEAVSVAVSHDGEMIVVGQVDGVIAVWDATLLTEPPRLLPAASAPVRWLAIGDGAQSIVAVDGDGQVYSWNLDQPEPNPVKTGLVEDTVSHLALSPDGTLLAAVTPSEGFPTHLRILDLTKPNDDVEHTRDKGGLSAVSSLAFSPDSTALAIGSSHSIQLIDLEETSAFEMQQQAAPERFPPKIDGFSAEVTAVAFAPDGGAVAAGLATGEIRLFDLDGAAAPMLLPYGAWLSGPHSVAFDADDRVVATFNEGVQRWRFSTRDHLVEGTMDVRLFDEVGSQDIARPFVEIRDNHNVLVNWDDPGGSSSAIARGNWQSVHAAELSSSRQVLAIGTDEAVLLCARPCESAAPTPLPGIGGATALAFSPDDAWLVAGGTDGTVRRWDLRDRDREPDTFAGASGSIAAVAVSVDGAVIFAGDADGAVMWDATHPRPAAVRFDLGSAVRDLAIRQSGRFVAMIVGEARIEVHRFNLVDAVCDTVWRNLTWQEWIDEVGPDVPYQRTCPDLPPGEGVPADQGGLAEPLATITADSALATGERSTRYSPSAGAA